MNRQGMAICTYICAGLVNYYSTLNALRNFILFPSSFESDKSHSPPEQVFMRSSFPKLAGANAKIQIRRKTGYYNPGGDQGSKGLDPIESSQETKSFVFIPQETTTPGSRIHRSELASYISCRRGLDKSPDQDKTASNSRI